MYQDPSGNVPILIPVAIWAGKHLAQTASGMAMDYAVAKATGNKFSATSSFAENVIDVSGVKKVKQVVKLADAAKYGKKSVPLGPYRDINGYPVKVKYGEQEKHIKGTPNFNQELKNGNYKSVIYGDNATIQRLLDSFAGKGDMFRPGKERIDFGKSIGQYYNRETGRYEETNKGVIHYGQNGAHIVPARP
jgi:toxin YxiD